MEADLPVRPGLTIPGWELWTTTSRGGGPGGQHVNKTSSVVTIHWVPASSSALTPAMKARIAQKLSHRLTVAGELQARATQSRQQIANREEARERLAAMVRDALHVAKYRRATRPTRGSKERRIAAKKARGETKSLRRVRPDDD